MNFLPEGRMYKLIEIDHALMICDPLVSVRTGQPLILGTAADVMTYLDRYFWEREHGATLAVAHQRATDGCGVTQQLTAADGRSALQTAPKVKG